MRKQVLLFALMVLPFISDAQRYFGVSQSNWDDVNSLYLNPANIADSRRKLTVNLVSLNLGLDNNLGTIDYGGVFNVLNDDFKIGDLIHQKNLGAVDFTLPYFETRLPGAVFSINSKHSLAISTRARTFLQGSNFSKDILQSATGSEGGNDYTSSAKNLNFTTHGWAEAGLTYGAVIYGKGKHALKGGLTLRYLLGALYANASSTQLNVIHNSDSSFTTIRQNSDLQVSASSTTTNGSGSVLSRLFKNAGKGVGGDAGLVYEYRPKAETFKYDMDGQTNIIDRSVNKYLFRFSASVTDIGSIKYGGNNEVINISNPNGDATFSNNELDQARKNTDSLKLLARSRGMIVTDNKVSTKVKLPTALLLALDFHAVKGLYVNLMYMNSLTKKEDIGNYYYNQVTLTPRYDVKLFSVAVPVTYSMMNKGFKVGLGARLGGFIIGSDDLLGLFHSTYGANAYFGFSVPLINNKKPKDSDGDQVSNKKDKCPGVKGVWTFMGCPDPDTDHDGIPDTADKCPTVAGSKTAMGCPDADLDSIPDATDRCPNEAGTLAMQGCPDRDGDGIADIDDACPDQKGLAQFKGCPDRDGDGIADGDDACPDKPGPLANKGCPDTDNDGIPDNEDKCPLVKGTRNNQGCPEISVEVKKRLAFAATAIQFETGKAVIKKTSFSLLDEIVKILNDYPDYYMTIDGHTDNVGKPDKNMILSKERADAVKNYMVGHGISESRLQTHGYGDTQPVESNKTAKGRAKNRRVAMDLKLQQ